MYLAYFVYYQHLYLLYLQFRKCNNFWLNPPAIYYLVKQTGKFAIQISNKSQMFSKTKRKLAIQISNKSQILITIAFDNATTLETVIVYIRRFQNLLVNTRF